MIIFDGPLNIRKATLIKPDVYQMAEYVEFFLHLTLKWYTELIQDNKQGVQSKHIKDDL